MDIKTSKLTLALIYWLPIAAVITIICLLIYTAVQQDLRISANDPQIQMAEDAATRLSEGQTPDLVVPKDTVDISTSLTPFLVIFDSQGQPIASSAKLNGATPHIPAGVFDYVKQYGEDRFSWQPGPGLRYAAVVTKYQGNQQGFVLAARSLREVEKRIGNLGLMVIVAWLISLVLSLVPAWALAYFQKKSYN